MSSPFPGMDPFLEDPAYWPDFRSRFINYWCEALADTLPANYEATLGERVYLVEHDPEARKLGYPDIALTHPKNASTKGSSDSSGVATLEPVTIPLTILEGPRESYIEILHQPDRTLVTALELLSPANKEQPGRTQYLEKRQALAYQKVHLVELDLLVGGRRMPMGKPYPAGDYHYVISRAEQRPDCQVYSWALNHPLPRLPVPLKAPDADIYIDLAAVFTTAYDRGRFRRRVPYHAPLSAAIRDEDRIWIKSVLAEPV